MLLDPLVNRMLNLMKDFKEDVTVEQYLHLVFTNVNIWFLSKFEVGRLLTVLWHIKKLQLSYLPKCELRIHVEDAHLSIFVTDDKGVTTELTVDDWSTSTLTFVELPTDGVKSTLNGGVYNLPTDDISLLRIGVISGILGDIDVIDKAKLKYIAKVDPIRWALMMSIEARYRYCLSIILKYLRRSNVEIDQNHITLYEIEERYIILNVDYCSTNELFIRFSFNLNGELIADGISVYGHLEQLGYQCSIDLIDSMGLNRTIEDKSMPCFDHFYKAAKEDGSE